MKRVKILRFFADYMDANLKEGSSNLIISTPCLLTRPLFVKQWMRTAEAMIMQLDDGTLQVITKLLLPSNCCYYTRFFLNLLFRSTFSRSTGNSSFLLQLSRLHPVMSSIW